jgi:uncharacterized protein YgiM (DUF1202 family)
MASRTFLFLLFLPALALACSLTASPVTVDRAGAMQPAREPVKINLEGAAQTAPSQALPSPTMTPVTCTVTADVLHLRACAGTHCTVLDWLEQGEELIILDTNADWIQVQTQTGETGWVKAKYCGGQS